MERDEAKAILELCRPGNLSDTQDPIIAEALGLLETDNELKAWFTEQQNLDARISESYNQIEPPADLRASILAGMRAHALQRESASITDAQDASSITDSSKGMGTTTSQSWWRNPWIGVAAIFALLFAISIASRDNVPTQFAEQKTSSLPAGVPPIIEFLANEIDALSNKQRSLEKRSGEATTLQAFLASAGAPSPINLPKPVSGKNSIGCITFEYNGIKMGMICFKEDELMHLTTVKKTDCMDQLCEETSTYEINDQAFKVWVQGDQVQILSVHGTKEKLPKFI